MNEEKKESFGSLKKWVKKHPIWSIFIGIIVFIFLVSKIGGTSTPVSNSLPEETQPVVVENLKQEPNQKAVVQKDTEVKPTPTKTTTTPTPTPTPTPIPSQTVSQKNAVAKAKSYLGYSAFSHDGLVAQLEYEQFSHADAVYGADNSGANWNEQSAKKAKSYMDMSAYSRGSLIAQLKYEKFTQAQAEYGANAVGL